jgi:hypothetical protein
LSSFNVGIVAPVPKKNLNWDTLLQKGTGPSRCISALPPALDDVAIQPTFLALAFAAVQASARKSGRLILRLLSCVFDAEKELAMFIVVRFCVDDPEARARHGDN